MIFGYGTWAKSTNVSEHLLLRTRRNSVGSIWSECASSVEKGEDGEEGEVKNRFEKQGKADRNAELCAQ
jgi:hypothetical protein